MEPVIDVLVTLVQIALAAFLLWGAALCMPDMWKVAPQQQASFERVASLVLLALLCTTLAGLG